MKAKTSSKEKKGSISVIIPVEPGGDTCACVDSAQKMVFGGFLEILVCEGRSPSAQRNCAADEARGEFLLFLDSDVWAEPDLAQHLLAALNDPEVAAAGGPNIAPQIQSRVQALISAVLASWFGSAGSRARYSPVGTERDSSEKELILCNLLVRREVFLDQGGFRQDMYPNEENEFLNRLQDKGWRLRYVPEAIVRRPRRETVAAFAVQAFRYGRGRMKQILVNPHRGDLLQLAPLVYGFLWLAWLGLGSSAEQAFLLAGAYLLPMFCFNALLALRGSCFAALASGLLFPLRHGAYGFGLLAGIVYGGPASPAKDEPLRITRFVKKSKGAKPSKKIRR